MGAGLSGSGVPITPLLHHSRASARPSRRQFLHASVLDGADCAFDDLLDGETVLAGGVDLITWDAGGHLLQPAVNALLEGGVEAGETTHDAVAHHGQLLAAPGIEGELLVA